MPAQPATGELRNLARIVVRPATFVLGRLRFLPKFALIGLLLLLPQMVVAWLQYSAATTSVEFNRSERAGMAYLEPLHDYLNAQQRHWLVAVARALGNQGMAKLETAIGDDLGRLEKEVDAVDARYGAALQTTARWKDAKAAWAKVVAASKGTPQEIDRAHQAATAITIDLIINQVANHSKLILDPDLDSYWLMDIAIVKAPNLGNQIALQATTAVLPITDKLDYAFDVIAPISAALATLSDTETVDLKTAFDNTKFFGRSQTLERTLRPAFTEVKASVLGLTDAIKANHLRSALAAGDAAAPAPTSGALDAALVALEKLDKFSDATNPELDGLIQQRVASYERARAQGVAFTVLGIVLFMYIFAGFYFGIAELVTSLGAATTRMVSGTTETFATPNRDETANIVRDFNVINEALIEARALQRRVQDENTEIQQNIVELLKVVSDASDGDLTVRAVTTSGTLGNVADAFNLLLESLEALVAEVSRQVEESETVVRAVVDVAQTMAGGATSQSREVASARALVDEVARRISEVSLDAEGASTASTHTASTAQAGERSVADVIHGMDELRANVQAGAKKMKNLGDRSLEITSIIGTISRISEQTNMLALNAAIEAARAGEHGRGFRVVADEVRKLAERASGATKDIEKLVKAITAETNETIRAIELQTQAVETESHTVGAAGDSLRKIREASDQSAALVANITSIARQQVEQTERVVRTMEAVSEIATATERGATATVSTVSNLVRLSAQLKDSIRKFRIGNGAN